VNALHGLRDSASGASNVVLAGSVPAGSAQASTLLATANPSALRDCVAQAVRRYLRDLGDNPVEDLHQMVLREVEVPLFAEVLRHYDGNQSRAAAALGINRSTLRKKLKEYKLG